MIKNQRKFNALECGLCRVHPECEYHLIYDKVYRSVKFISCERCPRLRSRRIKDII